MTIIALMYKVQLMYSSNNEKSPCLCKPRINCESEILFIPCRQEYFLISESKDNL